MAFSFRAGTNWCHDFPKLARESGFHFNMHRRRVRVDWNRISSIDVDRVIGERDFSTIDDNVNNVVDYCLESEYDVKILDSNFVKLFRLAQLAVEYLLYCKQYLDHSVVILNDELRTKQEENTRLKRELGDYEKIIKGLREKLRDRSRIVETRLSDSNGEIHKCPQCPKTFISALFMSAHVNRRHPNISRAATSTSSPIHEHYKAETEKLHSEIKSLKERLNLTERVIRNESEKFLTADSIVSNDNNRDTRNSEKSDTRNYRERDDIIAEQHRRYQEEIGNLKATIFNEIRNLKFTDRYTREKLDNDDYGNSSIKELIREQENEIRRLRQQICAKPTPEIDQVTTKRDENNELWQSKMENLEDRYRADIDKLYNQLKINQESSDRMLINYQTRMNELERREAFVESTLNQSLNDNNEKLSLSTLRHDNREKSLLHVEKREISTIIPEIEKNHIDSRFSDFPNDEISIENIDITKNSIVRDINDDISKKPSSTPKLSSKPRRERKNEKIHNPRINDNNSRRNGKREIEKNNFHQNLTNGETKNRLRANLRDEKLKSSFRESRDTRRGKIREKSFVSDDERSKDKFRRKSDFPTGTKSEKLNFSTEGESDERFSKIEKNGLTRNMRDGRNLKNYDNEESELSNEESDDDFIESESLENSSRTEDDEEEEDEEEEEEEEEEKEEEEIKNDYRKDRRSFDEKSWHYGGEKSKDGIEIFRSRLREFGIDPDWRGIPDATFSQVLEIVRHHRIINTKKYHKFEDIRRKLMHQLTRRLSIKEKNDKIEDYNEQSQLERLVTNVKSKVSKALNILDKNDGSRGSRQISATNKSTGRRDNDELRKISTNNSSSMKIIPMNVKETKKSLNSHDSLTSEDSCVNRSKISEKNSSNDKQHRIDKTTKDLRRLSQSYESIKDFIKDTNSRRARRNSNITGDNTMAYSRNEKNLEIPIVDTSIIVNDSLSRNSGIRASKQNDDISSIISVNSPKNCSSGKSVLKTTFGGSGGVGSIGSLTKKKVFFDLENSEKIANTEADEEMIFTNRKKMAINTNEKDTSESDFEISSIRDERNEDYDERKNDSSKLEKVVILKTSQSEKIAQISQQIEKQLSVKRRKPAGSIEAMFMEKFTLTSGESKESPLKVYPSFTSPTRSIEKNSTIETRVSRGNGEKWQKDDLDLSNEEKGKNEIDDENLEMDIDELLQME